MTDVEITKSDRKTGLPAIEYKYIYEKFGSNDFITNDKALAFKGINVR